MEQKTEKSRRRKARVLASLFPLSLVIAVGPTFFPAVHPSVCLSVRVRARACAYVYIVKVGVGVVKIPSVPGGSLPVSPPPPQHNSCFFFQPAVGGSKGVEREARPGLVPTLQSQAFLPEFHTASRYQWEAHGRVFPSRLQPIQVLSA